LFVRRTPPTHATVADFQARVRVPAGRSHAYRYTVETKAADPDGTGLAVGPSVGAGTVVAVGAAVADPVCPTCEAVAPPPHPTRTAVRTAASGLRKTLAGQVRVEPRERVLDEREAAAREPGGRGAVALRDLLVG
jgi:hypothetical protein